MMKRRYLSGLSLLVMLAVACQPIQPVTPTSTKPVATTSSPDSTAITETATVTDSASITASADLSATTEVTETAGITETNGRPAAASERTVSCPAITDDATDIDILAQWEEGEQRRYQLHQSRSESVEAENTLILSTTTPVTITVLSVADDGYTVEWDYGPSEVGGGGDEITDPLAGLVQSPVQIRMTYRTDEAGSYVELINLEELRAQLDPIFNQLFEAMGESDAGLDPEQIEAARGMVDQLISDPANFESLFTQDVQRFHIPYSFYFEDAEPLVLPDSRPNILGGAPIPSELTITPTHYSEDDDCLHVTFENVADPVETRNSILEALQLQAAQMGVPGPTEADLPAEMEMVDQIYYELEVDSGWPTALHSERSIILGNQSRLETTDIILVE